MVSHPTTGVGPTFWSDTYGLTTYAEFSAQAQRYLPNVLPFGDFGVDDTLIGLAWVSPWSASGLLIQSGLTLEGYTGVARSSGTQIFQQQQTGAVHSAQESAGAMLIIPDCFQVNIQMSVGGKQVENVIGVENAAGTAAGAATAVKTAWEIALGPLAKLLGAVAMTNYHAVDISSGSGAIFDLASTTTGSAGAGSLATRAACALVQWNGSTRNRSSRGRLYYGPLGEANINPDGATLVTIDRTNIGTAFTNFRNSLTTSGYPLVVLSRTLSQAFPVTQHAVELQIATQRRRIRV